ncbi:MAG: hypothetical protein M9930_13780 [Anaerolineae bacterium]|nr:hypothetical protein [Anaerolineae bacterium]
MGTKLLTEKYADDIHGVLHCYDRVLISGNLHSLCYTKGMTKYLYIHQIRIFDYTEKFAEPLRDLIRQNAQLVAQENELEIEFITRQADFRKEERIKAIIALKLILPGTTMLTSQGNCILKITE